ncbi:division/cell wall cluster transcriptional repressor MraZ [Dellaglioa algida]|uniref:Transcriptional regulator MraZ n=1 Tax=Dellaglioa algida TaxID=105612 RepID=A0A2C8ENM0_9LACO|nr:division/cell wall cluster transcriptional repressor MraZ [Dellaglioa algida]MDK1717406.1 division/cell wall cluster transcriptional repressor MraZ [Dellaglioa algida]MDK1718239.1 division/cell wall cluster transcriptional repressor MraZ [Dellaglioa algida]MDK1720719.1 division/cell wall cluster transcriptional repressor MraZ [Dellaglioa algida]MDK1722348.1 division/cell wall cluster transcriptional repressor MraZ [Dellaglioa algida]MDK1723972.1 division/cell wall cluster transcriptional re
MFMGEFKHTLDTKGRLIIPAKFREELGDKFVITRGMDGCLFGYTQTEWALLEDNLKTLPLTKKDSRAFVRFLYSAATECEFDKQGRINIPASLREHADLEKKCVLVGVSNRFEVWSEDRWNSFTESASENFDEIAENMVDFGF